jgi:hypothetical protein
MWKSKKNKEVEFKLLISLEVNVVNMFHSPLSFCSVKTIQLQKMQHQLFAYEVQHDG